MVYCEDHFIHLHVKAILPVKDKKKKEENKKKAAWFCEGEIKKVGLMRKELAV